MAQANTVDQSGAEIPIAVDMDGTLILTDMSWVSIRRVILRRPWSIVGMLAKEFTGRRAQWKRDLAERPVRGKRAVPATDGLGKCKRRVAPLVSETDSDSGLHL